jgi:hypothetical protein
MTMYRAGFDFNRGTRGFPRARLYIYAPIALALGLSACMSKQPARVAPPVVATPAIPEPVQPPVAPVAKPLPPKPRVSKPVAKAPESPVAVEPAAPVHVVGMSQDELRKALGEPMERIDQGPGQAWIYKTPKCTVEILFFLDVTRNGYYALDRKLSGTGDPAEQACYMDIQNARQH